MEEIFPFSDGEGLGEEEVTPVALPSEAELELRLEAYGSGDPSSQLLKILPNGIALFEATATNTLTANPFGESEEKLEDEHPIQRAYADSDANAAYIEDLRGKAEKFFLVTSEKFQQQLRASDPIARNQAVWTEAARNQALALVELTQLKQLFEFMSSPPPDSVSATVVPPATKANKKATPPQKKDTQIAVHNAIRERTPQHDMEELVLACTCRKKAVEPTCSDTIRLTTAITGAVEEQNMFLEVINQLRPIWKLIKVPYASHVFNESDSDYPYRAELMVELLSIPTSCWATEAHAPFHCWPPIPPISPFTPAFVELYLLSRQSTNKKRNEDENVSTQQADDEGSPVGRTSGDGDVDGPVQHETDQLAVYLRFSGDTAHFIQHRYHLRVNVDLIHLDFEESFVCQQQFDEARAPMNPSTRTSIAGTTIPLPLPQVVGRLSHNVTRAIDRQLQAARWVLVDRAVHCVLNGQALQLKQSSEEKKQGLMFTARDPNFGKIDPSHHGAQLGVHIEVSGWSSDSTYFVIKGLPVLDFRSSAATQGDSPVYCHAVVVAVLDLGVKFQFVPRQTVAHDHPQNLASGTGTHPFETFLVEELRRLGNAATPGIREQFLRTWRFVARSLPAACAELYPKATLLGEGFISPGTKILETMIEWIFQSVCCDLFPKYQKRENKQ